MGWQDWKLRLRALISPHRAEADLDDELQFHLAMQARKNREAGIDAAESRAALDFGNLTYTREACREARGLRLVDTVSQDIRYAIRGFRKTPGFAITVVATIALGLGLNTAAFTAFNAYVLRPLAVKDPYSLYETFWDEADGAGRRLTWQEFLDGRKNIAAFSEVLGYQTLLTRLESRTALGQLVSGNYFSMLGGDVMMGRPLLESDGSALGGEPVAVLSYMGWKNRYGGDPRILGKKIIVRGYPLEIVGVARAGFTGVGELPWDFWAPLTMAPQLMPSTNRDRPGADNIRLVGRLRSGWSLHRANDELHAWARQATAARPKGERLTSVELASRATTIPLMPEVALGLAPILVAFGLVLVVACANIANLMLARAMSRQREIGVRLALGASRTRLIRQLLTESILLAVPAALVGFFVSEATINGCVGLLYATMPREIRELMTLIPMNPDSRVFGFMLAASLAAALLFGLAPALQATRPNIIQAARGEFMADHRPTRLRHTLVVAQIAVSALILICAAILLRLNLRVTSVRPGLNLHSVVELQVPDSMADQVRRHLAADPLVESLEAANKAPIFGTLRYVAVTPEGVREATPAGYLLASPGYLSLFGVPILRGRNYTVDEARADAPVAVISEATARRLFPGRDAVGQRFRMELNRRQAAGANTPSYAEATVVGVARDAVNGWIGDGIDQTCIYFPAPVDAPGKVLLVRVRGDSAQARRQLDTGLSAAVPGAVDRIQSMEEILETQRYPFRIGYWLSGALAALTLALTLAGIYGVLSYLVAQRTKEIGIRVALGAGSGRVVGLVMKQSLRFAAIGAVIGGIAGMGASRLMASLIPDVQWFDVRALAIGVAVVFAASAFAAWAPSRRATQIEPVSALRCD